MINPTRTIPIQFIHSVIFVALLVLSNSAFSAFALEITVPDPGLNAAIRESLQKPDGPLTEQDMFTLTTLGACCRGINRIEGLEAARNLRMLDLHSNSLTNGVIPNSLTNLQIIDLSENQLTNLNLPANLNQLSNLDLNSNKFQSLTLPAGLTQLHGLNVSHNLFSSFSLPADLPSLSALDLGFNGLTMFLCRTASPI